MVKKSVKEISKSENEELLVKKFFPHIELPSYAMETDVGLDLISNETVEFMPMEQKAVRTGIAIKIPEGHVGLIRDRAGIVTKMNVHTAAGTIDPAYRGELSVVLINLSDESVEVEEGMKIAQLIVLPVKKVEVKEVKSLDVTERYDKGFGSTDKNVKERAKLLEKSKFFRHYIK